MVNQQGLFSFKNFQLMSIIDNLYRSSDFACALYHMGVN